MINESKALTRYFMNALRLDRLVRVQFDKNTAFFSVPCEKILEGYLDKETAEKLFKSYENSKFTGVNAGKNEIKSNSKIKENEEDKIIPVVISAVSIRNLNSSKIYGLLNIPADLHKSGELTFDSGQNTPWIPRERLATENKAKLDVMVGELKRYWWFELRHKEEALSQIDPDNWRQFLNYAKEMYKYVAVDVERQANESEYEYITQTSYIRVFENVNANGPIIDLYKGILDSSQSHFLYDRMINLKSPVEQNCINCDELDMPNSFLCGALNTRGSMQNRTFLADSQRRAVHAFQMSNQGEVLAVSGPPGTGKTTMLQSIVASLIVNSALEGKEAPIIVATSTNNQAVTNIIDSFSSVIHEDHGMFDSRWLLCADSDIADGKTISGIVTFCPSPKKRNEYKKYFCEQRNRSGVYSKYSAKEYIGRAVAYYIKCMNYCYDVDLTSLNSVAPFLRTQLREIDNLRCRILRNYDEWLKADERDFERELQDLKHEIKHQVNLYNENQNEIKKWRKVQSGGGIKERIRKFFVRESILIEEYKSINEVIPLEINSLDKVINYYKIILKNIENKYQDLKRREELVTHKLRSRRNIKQQLSAALKDAIDLCQNIKCAKMEGVDSLRNYYLKLMDVFETEVLIDRQQNCTVDHRLGLDRALDMTLRYIEFWLAIHYYESQWLMFCSGNKILSEEDRGKNTEEVQKRYWSQGPALTPCFVMTEYQLPKYFKIYDPKTKKNHWDFEKIDLLIVDEAGQVNSPVGLGAFSLSKKAIVVGDTHQLSPIWAFEEEADRAIAFDCGIEHHQWNSINKAGLTCSQPSSLMKVAMHACKWRYSEREAGLFLEEHYRCVNGIIQFCNELIYENRLVPSRGADSNLLGICSSFLFKKVPGSRDKKVGSSRSNSAEAEAVAEWIMGSKIFLENLYKKDIDQILGVVTPFASQAKLITNKISKHDRNLGEKIVVGTAHKLQGAERPVILFSMTYGDNSDSANFINNNPELMNVAVSRAKDLFIVFGAEKRRRDTGKVLQLLNTFAREDDCILSRKKINKKTSDKPRAKIELVKSPLDSAKTKTSKKSKLAKNDWKDELFLASDFSDIDIPDCSSVWVEADDDKYLSISKMIAEIKNKDLINGKMLSAKKTNELLLEKGLLQKQFYNNIGKKVWFPTVEGFILGIRVKQGFGADGEFVYCVYPRTCIEVITKIIKGSNIISKKSKEL